MRQLHEERSGRLQPIEEGTCDHVTVSLTMPVAKLKSKGQEGGAVLCAVAANLIEGCRKPDFYRFGRKQVAGGMYGARMDRWGGRVYWIEERCIGNQGPMESPPDASGSGITEYLRTRIRAWR